MAAVPIIAVATQAVIPSETTSVKIAVTAAAMATQIVVTPAKTIFRIATRVLLD